MNRNDWREGMENEAVSVNDAAWARETRLVAAQAKPNQLWLDVLFSTTALVLIPLAFWSYWTAIVNCRFRLSETAFNCWASQNMWGIDGLSFLLLFVTPFILGILRVRLNAVLLTFALTPVAKSLWPAVMPLLNLQPRLEDAGLPPLNMLNYVRFSWLTVGQMIGAVLLAWLAWLLGRKLSIKKARA